MTTWVPSRLDKLIKVEHGWPFKSEEFSDDPDLPVVVSIGNFRYTGGFRFDTTLRKTYSGHYPDQYRLEPGELLMVMTCQTPGGEILGVPGRIPSDGRLYLHNQRMGRIKRVSARIDLDFLYWLFLSRPFNQHLVSTASGTKILHTSPSRIEAYSFQLPPLSEQRAIARILGALDDKIELNRKTNETLEAMARALFQSWFVDFDPVRAKMEGRQPEGMDAETAALFPSALTNSSDQQSPVGWNLAPLSTSASVIMGASPPGDSYNDEGVGIALINGPVEFGPHYPIRRKWTTLPTRLSADGDLIFCVRGSTTGKMILADGQYVLGRGVAAIRSEEGCQAHLNWLIRTQLPRLLERTSGSVFPNLSGEDLRDFIVLTPPIQARQAFAHKVGPLESATSRLVREAETLTALRDALLPKLLSGELRVPEAERAVSEVL